MKNVYVGDAFHSHEIQRIYGDLFEDMRGGVCIYEYDGDLEILLFEDYRIPNNPFSDFTNFPLNVSFSVEKIIQEENFMYNMWEIRFPFNLIERITEEYEENVPEHEYNVFFKNGSKIKIIGKRCWINLDGSSCLFDSENGDLFNDHCDIYNKVQMFSVITEKEVLINYLKDALERKKDSLKRLTNPIRKVATSRKIEEIRKRLMKLERRDIK